MEKNHLIRKYNIPGPRYTSYPTVPYWDSAPVTEKIWKEQVTKAWQMDAQSGLSLYVHLPYCESLCTYCGCNTRITVNHAVESPYIDAVLKEWQLYLSVLGEKPLLRELHLGGGTPTFFSPENLHRLVSGILEMCELHPEHEFGFEAHPNNTTTEHLQTLYDLGFRRLSLGIQDFDPKVQEIVNRIQPVDRVEQCTREARLIGYTSVNYDLIYGLPLQTMESVAGTIAEVVRLKPDRIAYYSYAHVPWIKPGQRKFTEHDLPEDELKRALYENGRAMLEQAGYVEIGMDHFALPEDGLYHAFREGKMHRNFMGYTTTATGLLIGLGVSAISDAWYAFAQNLKKVEDYLQVISEGRLPIFRGHVLSDEDLFIRRRILDIMCRFRTEWKNGEYEDLIEASLDRLKEMVSDELVICHPKGLEISEAGKAFVRNACMAFDARLWQSTPSGELFSKVI